MVAAMVAVVPASAAAASADNAGSDVAVQETVVDRYGPWTVGPDTMTGVKVFNFPRPCQDCYITGIQADLVYADGTIANHHTSAMLHHMVLLNTARPDATCPRSRVPGPTSRVASGERFYAAGNERTPLTLPDGYGYRINRTDRLFGVIDLGNHSHSMAQTFYVKVTYTVTTSTLTQARPVWLDLGPCGSSLYSIPAGYSDTHLDWTVNVPGRVVYLGGHQHDEGVRIEATLETPQGSTSICDSVAGYGETPEFIDHHGGVHLSSMSTCVGDVATLTEGQKVRVHSIYDSQTAHDDVMGIMFMYIA
jgi:hypothetical protein